MATEPDAVDAYVLERNWLAPLGFLVAGGAAAWIGEAGSPVASLVAVICFFLAPFTLARSSWPRARRAKVASRPKGIEVLTLARGSTSIDFDDVVETRLLPRASSELDVVLELRTKRAQTVALWLSDREARTLAARIGPRRAAFRISVPFGRRLAASLLLIGAPWFLHLVRFVDELAVLVLVVPFAVLPTCLFLAWLAGFARGRCVVGADGFTERWLLFRRFTPFSAVRDVTTAGAAVDTFVHLRSGKVRRLHALDSPASREERAFEGRTLFAGLHGAFVRYARGPQAPTTALPNVARGAKSPREWLGALDELARSGATDYRTAPLDASALEALARNPRAAPDTRVGAAVALVRRDDAARPSVRIAAEACADPSMRQRLVEISEAEDDDAVAATLARFAAR